MFNIELAVICMPYSAKYWWGKSLARKTLVNLAEGELSFVKQKPMYRLLVNKNYLTQTSKG